MPRGTGYRLAPAVLCAVFLALASPSVAFEGPLQVRNQFPLFVSLNTPYLESAEVSDSATVALSHSSVYVTQASPAWTVNMDLELTELMVRLKKKAGSRTEFGLDLPVLRPTAGFLDGPLESFHDFLGTGDYGRHERPQNEFLYEILHLGSPVILPVNGQAGFGDVRLSLKRVLIDQGPLVSILATIELPTGDAKQGYGNGSYDASLALLVDMDLGKEYRGYGTAGAVVPGPLKGYQTIPMRAYAFSGLGIEAAWWERFSLIAQTVVAGSPYPETGIRQVDWPGVMLTVGGRYALPAGGIELSLTEDLDTAGAPDFIFNLSTTWKF